MKAKHCIPFLLLWHWLLVYQTARAQKNIDALNIRGDTLSLNLKTSVVIVFPSAPVKADIFEPDGSYSVDDAGKNSLSLKAVKGGAVDQMLEVVEGNRNHLFILSYKDGSPAQRIDLSNRKKLGAYAMEKKKNVSRALLKADSLFKKAVDGPSNQALWESIEATYKQLEKAIDVKDTGVVKSRLEESRNQVQSIKTRFNDAMKEGQNYHLSKNYVEAGKAYLKAKAFNSESLEVLTAININDSLWAKKYIDKGDEATKAGKKIDAKSLYKEAFYIKPDYPLLQDKFKQATKDADQLIFVIEKKKGDDAMKANDTEEARRAYDSILSIYPNDGYTIKQLKKLAVEEDKIVQEERREAEYQAILATAKSLAEKASNTADYDLSIEQYKRASAMIPLRKFPYKKVRELTKKKGGLRVN